MSCGEKEVVRETSDGLLGIAQAAQDGASDAGIAFATDVLMTDHEVRCVRAPVDDLRCAYLWSVAWRDGSLRCDRAGSRFRAT